MRSNGAYEPWDAQGRPEGWQLELWLTAEQGVAVQDDAADSDDAVALNCHFND